MVVRLPMAGEDFWNGGDFRERFVGKYIPRSLIFGMTSVGPRREDPFLIVVL